MREKEDSLTKEERKAANVEEKARGECLRN